MYVCKLLGRKYLQNALSLERESSVHISACYSKAFNPIFVPDINTSTISHDNDLYAAVSSPNLIGRDLSCQMFALSPTQEPTPWVFGP